jgi:hypothetical protein
MGLPEQRHCSGGSAAATIAIVQGSEAAQSQRRDGDVNAVFICFNGVLMVF